MCTQAGRRKESRSLGLRSGGRPDSGLLGTRASAAFSVEGKWLLLVHYSCNFIVSPHRGKSPGLGVIKVWNVVEMQSISCS